MTTDPLDGLEQLRRIIDEQPEPAPESVMLGLDYCYAEWVAERARHAEEVARLRDVHLDETRALDDLRLKEIASLRDQLRGSCEAEELRSGLEKLMADGDPRGADIVSRDSLQALLDKVDARDSLLTLETIDSLRDQLREVEGEREEALRMVDGLRKSEKTARESMAINMRLRDEAQAENVQLKAELTTLRSLLPDVRACAEYLVEPVSCLPSGLRQSARNILAALDSQGGEGAAQGPVRQSRLPRPEGPHPMTEPRENDLYRHPHYGEEVIIDYVTDAEVYLRVTDGAGGLIRACRVPRTNWLAIREVHGLELTNREETES